MEDFFTLEKQLCFTIYDTAGEFTKLYTSALQPFGLTYPQYLVLLALWEKDGITAKELGERLNLGTGTLTPMIARMASKGWLQKERSKSDERKVNIYLQEKARKQKQHIIHEVSETIQTCRIEVDEYEKLMMQLESLRRKLKSREQ